MMKFYSCYIAGHFQFRNIFRTYRDRFKSMGIECSSSWLDLPPGTPVVPQQGEGVDEADMDIREVVEADALILDETMGNRGLGKYVELGAALACIYMRRGPRYVFIIGPPDKAKKSIFHLKATAVFPSWDAFFKEVIPYPAGMYMKEKKS